MITDVKIEIEHAQVIFLNELFDSTGKDHSIKEIFDALNLSYNSFMKSLPDLLKQNDVYKINFQLHKLRNKFNNLGMLTCVKELDALDKDKLNSVINIRDFQNVVDKSLDYFLKKYLS